MNFDDAMQASVEQIARSVEPPVPDPAGIRGRARTGQRRRLLVGVSVAAALLAAVSSGIWYVAGQDDGSSPAQPSPTVEESAGPGQVSPDGAIWYADGILHDDQRSFRIPGKVATNLAVVAAGVLYGDDAGNVIYQHQDGTTATIGTDAPLGPSGDPTSDVAVWFEQHSGAVELVVYDVAKDKELGRADLGSITLQTPESMVGRNQPPVLWVGEGETGVAAVYFRAEGSVWRYEWTSGESPQPLEGKPSGALDVGGDVLAFTGPGEGGMTFTNSDGRELSTFTPVEPDGALSHDGKYYVGYSTDGSVIIDTATGQERPLDLDGYPLVVGMTWARDNTVVMLAPSLNEAGTGFVVACDAISLQCDNGQQVDNFALIVLPTFSGQ